MCHPFCKRSTLSECVCPYVCVPAVVAHKNYIDAPKQSQRSEVMTGKCLHSDTRGPSHAAFPRGRTNLRVNPATPLFEQRLMRATRAKRAKNSSRTLASADARDLPQVRTLLVPLIAPHWVAHTSIRHSQLSIPASLQQVRS